MNLKSEKKMKKLFILMALMINTSAFASNLLKQAARNFVGVYDLLPDNDAQCAHGLLINFFTYNDGKQAIHIDDIGNGAYIDDRFEKKDIKDPKHLLIDFEYEEMKTYVSFKEDSEMPHVYIYKFHLKFGEDESQGTCTYLKKQIQFDIN
jgi:hypothetical protein